MRHAHKDEPRNEIQESKHYIYRSAPSPASQEVPGETGRPKAKVTQNCEKSQSLKGREMRKIDSTWIKQK